MRIYCHRLEKFQQDHVLDGGNVGSSEEGMSKSEEKRSQLCIIVSSLKYTIPLTRTETT